MSLVLSLTPFMPSSSALLPFPPNLKAKILLNVTSPSMFFYMVSLLNKISCSSAKKGVRPGVRQVFEDRSLLSDFCNKCVSV